MRQFYEWLRPFSPYKERQDLPSFRLWARTNDSGEHGVARIGLMAQWAGYAALIAGALELVPVFRHTIMPGVIAVLVLLGVKLWHVLDGTYKADPLDWTCDVICWGGLGAYVVTRAFLHAAPAVDVVVVGVLALLWVITYPWSTPR